MDIKGLRDWPRFRSGSSSDIVRATIQNHVFFKPAVLILRERAPDADAAGVLIETFDAGEAPAWLTACLLGAVGHDSGYDTVVHILQEHTGSLAESYAGPALALIDPVRANRDLRTILNEHPKLKAREGAAYGLLEIGPSDLAALLIEALKGSKLRPRLAATFLSKLNAADSILVDLLASEDEPMRRAAVHVLDDELLREHVRPAVLEIAVGRIERNEIRVAPRTRRQILQAGTRDGQDPG